MQPSNYLYFYFSIFCKKKEEISATRMLGRVPIPSLHSDRAERKRIYADVNGTFTEPRIPGTLPCILPKKQTEHAASCDSPVCFLLLYTYFMQ